MRRAVPIAALAVAVAAATLWAVRRPDDTSVPSEQAHTAAGVDAPRPSRGMGAVNAAGPHCAFEPNQRLTFAFASDLNTTVQADNLLGGALQSAPATPPESLHISSHGRIHALVTAVTESREAIVAVRVDDWTFEPASVGESTPWRSDLERPYLIRMGPDCRILDVARHREAHVAAFAQVVGLLDRMQATVPDDTTATPTWVARQQDEYGISSWRYTWSTGAGRGTLRRERVAFDAASSAGGALGLRFSGTTVGEIALGDGPWFARLADTEDVVGSSRGAPVFTFEGTTSFDRVDADPDGFAGHAVRVGDFVWGRPSPEAVDRAQAGSRTGTLAGVALDDVLREFHTIRASGQPGSWREGQELLRAWILANPEQVPTVVARMRNGEIDEHEAAEWALALARSGSEVALRELEALAVDGNAGENVRIQATSALADVRHPDQQTIDTLTSLSARITGASEHDLVGSTATMALGSLMATHPVNEQVFNGAQNHLQAMLQHPDPVMVAEALWAVGNSRDESFIPRLERLHASPERRVRRGVARATRGMERDDTSEILANLLREDTDPAVVIEVVDSHREQMLAGGPTLTPYELSLYRTKLPSAPEDVRRAMIEALGVASRRSPEASQILVSWFPLETSQPLRVMIGRYIEASQLP